jgi:hypothetical protein
MKIKSTDFSNHLQIGRVHNNARENYSCTKNKKHEEMTKSRKLFILTAAHDVIKTNRLTKISKHCIRLLPKEDL